MHNIENGQKQNDQECLPKQLNPGVYFFSKHPVLGYCFIPVTGITYPSCIKAGKENKITLNGGEKFTYFG